MLFSNQEDAKVSYPLGPPSESEQYRKQLESIIDQATSIHGKKNPSSFHVTAAAKQQRRGHRATKSKAEKDSIDSMAQSKKE